MIKTAACTIFQQITVSAAGELSHGKKLVKTASISGKENTCLRRNKMKLNIILSVAAVLAVHASRPSFASEPLATCEPGYEYTCDSNNFCDCNAVSRGSMDSFVLNFEEIEINYILNEQFYLTLLANGYGEADALYVVDLVNAYTEQYPDADLDKIFKRYLRKNGLSRQEASFVVNSLSVLFEDDNATRYLQYELENTIITSYQFS